MLTNEVKFVRSDLGFYMDLMQNLAPRPSSSIFIFNLLPYLSLFTVETQAFLTRNFPDYVTSLNEQHIATIRASRMRVKLFDDSSARVSGSFELFDWIKEYQEKVFILSHQGILAPLKKMLQPDLGITIYNSHIIGTTHINVLLTGLDIDTLTKIEDYGEQSWGKYMYSVARDIGSYFGKMSNFPEFDPVNLNSFNYQLEDEQGYYLDIKSSRFLRQIFNGKSSIAVNFSLLYFLSQINFMLFVLPKLLSKTCITLFKLKFILLYHLASSLQKLQNYCYPRNILTSRSKDYFKTLLKDKRLKEIMSKKKLRNVLVHYSFIENNQESGSNFAFTSFIENHFSNMSFGEIEALVNEKLLHISITLEEWLNWKPSESAVKPWHL